MWGCASSGITPPGQGPSRDLNHGPYFDTQATLPTTGPHRPWQTPHAPSPPSCRSPRARTTARALHSVIHRDPCTSSASMLVLPYPSHSRVSLYCCVVVSHSARLSPFLHSSCFHMLVLPVLPHARASIPITLTLYRCCCIVVSLHLVVSLSRCLVVSLCVISWSPCIVVSLYLVVSFCRCISRVRAQGLLASPLLHQGQITGSTTGGLRVMQSLNLVRCASFNLAPIMAPMAPHLQQPRRRRRRSGDRRCSAGAAPRRGGVRGADAWVAPHTLCLRA